MSLEEPSSSLSSSTAEIIKPIFLLLISSGLNYLIMNQNLQPINNQMVLISNKQTEMSNKQTELSNKQTELDFKISAAGFGFAGSLAVFAGAGNIVKVLEYWDKKYNTQK